MIRRSEARAICRHMAATEAEEVGSFEVRIVEGNRGGGFCGSNGGGRGGGRFGGLERFERDMVEEVRG